MQFSHSAPELTDSELLAISRIVYRESGINLPPGKSAMVRTRLAKRLRSLAFSSFSDYSAYLLSDDGHTEIPKLISALTTNVSHFFREMHHFDALVDLLKTRVKANGNGTEIRIWSAGCATGQEPISIAIALLKTSIPQKYRVKVLATDIDAEALSFAEAGRYPRHMWQGLSERDLADYFDCTDQDASVRREVSDLIHYKQLNLMDAWPMKSKFDAIFCRNVVIYFDAETKARIFRRFHSQMISGGHLFLGHSERMSEENRDLYEKVGITTYLPRTSQPRSHPCQ
ncbi:protein-glutamate O-methyltransferase CheR [uncultured Maritimibacter sp.]|jgi:chemotaxis protein methyltransferase CheR|uniref:CheR family methyltransferase n=1 Tax=uncultured Maritimibacter sp. TaxID=991866 RepID=UPI000AA23470|nr:protein-glutamate O-methyltransferase CheR [uncultured Maritimibacter sp.]